MMHGKFCGPGKSTRAVLLFCLAFFLVAPAAAVWAETDVSGTLSADTTWTLAGSPYVVSGGILVAAGATLTIEPGVTVKFNANLALKIDGTLIARGTSGANITFTSSNPAPAPGDWGYILFTDTSTDAAFDANGDYVSGSILEYATVMYAGSTYASPGGAVGIMSSYPFINHCTITSNAKGAIAANNLNDNPAKTLKITHNIISHNTFASSGAAGIYIWSAGAVLIAGNRITRNTGASGGGGINLFYGVSVTVSNNIITHNTSSGDGGGIYMYRSDPVAVSGNIVAGNTATGGGGGILSSDGKVTFSGNLIFDNSAPNSPGVNLASNDVLTYNTITGNTASDSAPTTALFAGRLYGGRTDPRLNYNNLYGNSATYQFWNDNSQAAPPYLNARSNWWGKGAEADVAAAVYDFVDDSSKGTVDYSLPETAIRSDVPISPPTGLAVNPGGNPGEITISWNPNSESDLAGYRVYWGPENTYPFPNMVDAGNATSHTLTGLAPGLYQVGVTAYDATDASIANDPASPVYQKQTSGHESWHATLAAYSDSHTLTVAKTGTGSGTVTSSPAGVDCGSGCLAAYPSGTQVALSAKAAAGSTFTGWSGGCTGTAPLHGDHGRGHGRDRGIYE